MIENKNFSKRREKVMKKYFFAVIGALVIIIGGIDWVLGALVPHSRLLILIGAAMVAAAGFFLWREKSRQDFRLPLMGLIVMPLDKVLTPPETTPMLQWNPNAVSGYEVWIFVAILIGYFLFFRFWRGCFR
jgi:hypothetical protein